MPARTIPVVDTPSPTEVHGPVITLDTGRLVVVCRAKTVFERPRLHVTDPTGLQVFEVPGIRPAAFLASFFLPGTRMREWPLHRRPGKFIVNEKLLRRKRPAAPNRSSFP